MGKAYWDIRAEKRNRLQDAIGFTVDEISEVLKDIWLLSDYQKCRTADFEKYIFGDGNEQEIYGYEERLFIESVGTVFVYEGNGKLVKRGIMPCRIIAADMDGAYVLKDCLTFMKIVCKAMEGFTVFFLRTEDGFYLGCRKFGEDESDNCCISQVICTEEGLLELAEHAFYINDSEDFLRYYASVMDVLEAQKSADEDYEQKLFSRRGVQYSYLESLKEIEKKCGSTCNRTRESYMEQFDVHDKEGALRDEVPAILQELSFIKSSKVNSLEMLFEAEERLMLANKFEEENINLVQRVEAVKDEEMITHEQIKNYLSNPEAAIKMMKESHGIL